MTIVRFCFFGYCVRNKIDLNTLDIFLTNNSDAMKTVLSLI